MHNIRIMKTKKCNVSSYGLLLIHPSFGHKIDPQQDNNPREKNFQFGIICEGENILQWKCWRWKCERRWLWEVWSLPIGRRHSASTCGSTTSTHPFSTATFHNKTIVCLIANQNMEDMRHTDVLMNVSSGDLLPYDPGYSCLWCDAVHWIPDT